MKQLRQYTESSLLPLLIWLLMLSDHAEGNEVTFFVVNKCPFTIWPAIAPNKGSPVIADGGFCLQSDQVKRIQAPPTWSGRLWARTGCDFTSRDLTSQWKQACQTGDCDGRLECNGIVGTPPATLIQFSLQPSQSKLSFYDVSLVDGYNLPVSINAKSSEANCFIGGCRKNINSVCPPELQVLDDSETVVACKSACLAFNLDVFCCRNAYGSPEKCRVNTYSKLFKDACPSYYSYAFDTPAPLVTCSSKDYIITFCPSRWGDHVHSHIDE
ncbi:thaumatin-like protein [Macadamia integrifolia]|uniref:thaumatin-like protein n=1 Tax=Macadamia integrifolia TaxID=60698 RepID=UPI001C4EF6F5|nr:thaumatin-like protein [Macadamia integrifolia]